jgi:hypothetical protein
MKNPCKECLLINNCTAICEDKTNFQTLLRNAMVLYDYGLECKSKESKKRYTFWSDLRLENEVEMLRIFRRVERIKQG